MIDDDELPRAPESDPRFLKLLREVSRAPRYAPIQVGSTIGEYRIVRQLGKGSHGTVYEAVHVIIEKAAALKVLNPDLSGEPMVVQRFVDEARAVNRIHHPNIVDIFGFGELPDGRKYCVMDLLQGVTLAERLQELGRMSPPEALEILREIASALDAAHAAGVVHRDLKPQNVFLSRTSDGKRRVTLLDFGLARMAGDDERLRTGNGVVLGTPAYMSPEQCAGVEVTHSTDVYALGIAAFELLTGRIPFTGTSFGALIAQHLTAPPPKPCSLVPSLPPCVDVVFERWLAKSPEDRPASASAAVELLSVGLVPKPFARARPWLGALAVALMLALLLWLRRT